MGNNGYNVIRGLKPNGSSSFYPTMPESQTIRVPYRKGDGELLQKVCEEVLLALQQAHGSEEDEKDGDGQSRLVQEDLGGHDAAKSTTTFGDSFHLKWL